MPTGSPVASITRSSFTLISSLISNSFALIAVYLRQKNNVREAQAYRTNTLPKNPNSPQKFSISTHARLIRQGENSLFYFLFLGIIPRLAPLVNTFLKKCFSFFLARFSPRITIRKNFFTPRFPMSKLHKSPALVAIQKTIRHKSQLYQGETRHFSLGTTQCRTTHCRCKSAQKI